MADAQDKPSEHHVVHGTVNIVLANQQGLIVLTDSMLTAGKQQLSQPGQKLFVLDDQTVCTIAGFYSAEGPDKIPELHTATAAVMYKYKKEVAGQPKQTIREKLTGLSFLLGRELSEIAVWAFPSNAHNKERSITFS